MSGGFAGQGMNPDWTLRAPGPPLNPANLAAMGLMPGARIKQRTYATEKLNRCKRLVLLHKSWIVQGRVIGDNIERLRPSPRCA
jgi:hypothetical protein